MDLNVIYNQDCIIGSKEKIEDNSVDLIVTDPPFAIDFSGLRSNYNRNPLRVVNEYKDIPEKAYFDFTKEWITEAKRVLKEEGSMYIFSGWNNLIDILNVLHELDFKIINHIIWKYQFGMNCTKRFISSHYHLLYVSKGNKKRKFYPYSRFSSTEKTKDGKRKARYADMEDVWTINRENWTGMKKTATKLPAEIIRKILSYSSDKEDLVVDFFSGSGQVPWVCKEMERSFIAFELNKEAYNLSMERLKTNKYLILDEQIKKIV